MNNGISGIYKITVNRFGKSPMFYIGQSVNFEKRKQYHLWSFRARKGRNPILQRAFEKYGEDAFVFQMVEQVPRDGALLAAAEKRWLDSVVAQYGEGSVYNILREETTSRAGIPHSSETRAKMSEVQKSIGMTPARWAGVEKTRAKLIGRKLSPETIRKRTESHKGVKRTEEWKAMMSAKMTGRTNSAETRAKISATKKSLGQKPSAEHMERLRQMAIGRVMPKEHMKKLADMKLGTKKSPEEISRRTETRRLNAIAKGKAY